MNRYFIELSFKGTNYHGWQSQTNAKTVQSLIEAAFKKLTGELIEITGSGRTDAGVHARFFTAHFETNSPFPDERPGFIYKLNCILPEDIVIRDIYRVRPEMHARYSAFSRTYEYSISPVKDPFDTEFSWYHPRPLDLQLMNKASEILLTYTDFTSFSKLHSDVKTNVCHIMKARWFMRDQKIIFSIQADRFLRNMVRAIVGTLVEIGLCKITMAVLITIIEGKDRQLAKFSAPACGLTLVGVEYPEDLRL
jgi:tRNA pseudouridine38-40 synthase